MTNFRGYWLWFDVIEFNFRVLVADKCTLDLYEVLYFSAEAPEKRQLLMQVTSHWNYSDSDQFVSHYNWRTETPSSSSTSLAMELSQVH